MNVEYQLKKLGEEFLFFVRNRGSIRIARRAALFEGGCRGSEFLKETGECETRREGPEWSLSLSVFFSAFWEESLRRFFIEFIQKPKLCSST